MRAVVFQVLFLVGIVAFFAYVLDNTLNNLEQRGISTGFGFLSVEAGFGILQTLIEYSETSLYGRTFAVGLLNTLLVSALGILLAIVQQAFADPDWLGFSVEGYVFSGLVFWLFCYGMSRYSQTLERRLHTGHAP